MTNPDDLAGDHHHGGALEVLQTALEEVGLHATLRSADARGWEAAWNALSYQPVAYSTPMLDYQHAYLRGAGWQFTDLSLVLRNGDAVCGIWPLIMGTPPRDTGRLTSTGGPVFGPLFTRDISDRTQKYICGHAVDLILVLCERLALKQARLTQHVIPDAGGRPGVTRWHQQLMARGATPSVRHELLVDLSPPLPAIRSTYRKSYRALINVGLRDWQSQLMDHTDLSEETWEEFIVLHHTAAGRATRSDETWTAQFKMIELGHAFLVCINDPLDHRLVTGCFYQMTRDEGLYAVSAGDRTLFDRPLGHVAQQLAIEYMKAQGLRWLLLGALNYAQDSPKPTPKEISIANFKQGFASDVVCRYEFELPLIKQGT